MEIKNEAAEKFKDRIDEICGFLFDILRRINELETKICERGEELEKKRPEPHIVAPGEDELWEEYRTRLGDIVKPVCAGKLLQRGYGGSYSDPAKYGYIDGECKAEFIMKSEKRAVVVTHYHHGIGMKHRFVMVKNDNGGWLIDSVSYGFENEPDKWHSDRIR